MVGPPLVIAPGWGDTSPALLCASLRPLGKEKDGRRRRHHRNPHSLCSSYHFILKHPMSCLIPAWIYDAEDGLFGVSAAEIDLLY